MLTIKDNDHNKYITWHVGDPFPKVRGPVVTFQADGHELYYFLEVLRAHEDRAYAIAVKGESVIKEKETHG
jgi:hypothetical protein